MKIGRYTLSALETGTFALDGGSMFGVVPKSMWEKTNPADEQNRIDMRLRVLLIQKPADELGPPWNILVDVGMGTKWTEKFAKIYKVDHSKWSMITGLASKGLKPEEITHVILTHLHFDHAGGLTVRQNPLDPHSELYPLFPNAKVYLQKANWDWAWKPTEKDKASYLQENFSIYKTEAALVRKLELVETRATDPLGKTPFNGPDSEETEILPGIFVEVSHGHTLGMQLVRVSSGKKGESLIYCADLIPTASHVRTPWIMGYDCFPMFIMEEKKRLLGRAMEEGAVLFYEHCPRMAASQVVKNERGEFEAGASVQI